MFDSLNVWQRDGTRDEFLHDINIKISVGNEILNYTDKYILEKKLTSSANKMNMNKEHKIYIKSTGTL